MQSTSSSGQYGVVVCTDPAVHPQPETLSSIGCSAVALFVSEDAAMVSEPLRVTFIRHAWDFYRPVTRCLYLFPC